MHQSTRQTTFTQALAGRNPGRRDASGIGTALGRLVPRTARVAGGAPSALLVVVLAGCVAAPPSNPGVASVREGVVESVAQVAPRRVGALTGMLVGGVIGNRGSGAENRMVGVTLGALGGAWAVNSSGLDPRSQGYRVTVRLDDGGVEHLQNSDPVSIAVGQRVMIAGHKLVRPTALSGDASHVSSASL